MQYRVYVAGRLERSFKSRQEAINYIVDEYDVHPEDEDEGKWGLGMSYPDQSEYNPGLDGSRHYTVKIVEVKTR